MPRVVKDSNSERPRNDAIVVESDVEDNHRYNTRKRSVGSDSTLYRITTRQQSPVVNGKSISKQPAYAEEVTLMNTENADDHSKMANLITTDKSMATDKAVPTADNEVHMKTAETTTDDKAMATEIAKPTNVKAVNKKATKKVKGGAANTKKAKANTTDTKVANKKKAKLQIEYSHTSNDKTVKSKTINRKKQGSPTLKRKQPKSSIGAPPSHSTLVSEEQLLVEESTSAFSIDNSPMIKLVDDKDHLQKPMSSQGNETNMLQQVGFSHVPYFMPPSDILDGASILTPVNDISKLEAEHQDTTMYNTHTVIEDIGTTERPASTETLPVLQCGTTSSTTLASQANTLLSTELESLLPPVNEMALDIGMDLFGVVDLNEFLYGNSNVASSSQDNLYYENNDNDNRGITHDDFSALFNVPYIPWTSFNNGLSTATDINSQFTPFILADSQSTPDMQSNSQSAPVIRSNNHFPSVTTADQYLL